MKYFSAVCIVCIFFTFPLCAFNRYGQDEFDNSSWRILERANIAFEKRDYGSAFHFAENAKEKRKQETADSSAILTQALSPPALIKAGNDIQTVLQLLKERGSADAVRIIEALINRFGIEYFDYSIQKLTDYVKSSFVYPEADFLLGKLYTLEGEYATAESFFSFAYLNRTYLDVPEMQSDILYGMAELYKLQGNNEKYESALLLLGSQDDVYGVQNSKDGQSQSSFGSAVYAALAKGMSADKLFLLYRNDTYKTLRVWFLLSEYYNSYGLTDRALQTALLFCVTAVSRADDIIKSRDMDYAYTKLVLLFKKIKMYSDITDWASQNNLWEGFYALGVLCEKQGFVSFAYDIFSALASESPDRTWKILAEKELRK